MAPPFKKLPVSGYGAVEKITLERGKILHKFGFDIYYIAPEGSTIEFAKEIYSTNHLSRETTSVEGVPKSMNYSKLSNSLLYYKAFNGIRISKDFDFVINESSLYDPLNYCNFRKILGVERRIDIMHGNPVQAIKHRKPPVVKFPIFGALNQHLRQVLNKNGWMVSYFPNGVLVPERSRVVLNPDNFLIFIGRLTPSKGVDIAIRISKKLGIKLVIFGPIQDENYFNMKLRPYLNESTIVYMGERPWSVVEDYLSRALALVFSSTFDDPQPTVILEALSHGVPIVATKPGYFSGFYDMCNEMNSIIMNDRYERTHDLNYINKLSRIEIYERALKKWSWENVVKSIYLPLIEYYL